MASLAVDDIRMEAIAAVSGLPLARRPLRCEAALEGVLLWLDDDALLRERSLGRRGIDDFARNFFAGASSEAPTRTYVFDNV